MRILYFFLAALVLSSILIFFSIPTLKEFRRSKIIESEIASLESEAEKLAAQNNFLKEKIEYLKSDNYKESVAKDRLSLRNVGEKIAVVQPKSEVLGAATDDLLTQAELIDKKAADKPADNMPNYKKWWIVISGKSDNL